ncbi:glutathione S-transferase N-terminal domain-containing protein [Paraburkholderia unamae]|uniref:Glutathione S-transferase n=1 Tax=Paraburkholderia unamae TaxID=219649 RepID=A0ABX5KP71_9BURK|nr:glutathione S-transferase N-terminal domain-containing protein [Paraburkholderia unamae]PVX82828.1 glutathione S-transferase [Paraburkholderia unamae]CAG9269185.1 Glutathione S-transferase family protein [Paraburkholderia unamae]
MKLHWSPRSPFVRKVMVCALETGVAPRIECVRSPVAMDKPNPDLMRDNPLSKLPTLVLDDGLVLFDSSVICEYLDTLHDGNRLFPVAGRERFVALQQQAFADGLLDVLLLWRQERNKPEAQQRAQWLAGFAAKSAASLDALEALAPTLRLDAIQIGDIAIACVLAYYDFRLPDLQWREGRPELAAWHAQFAQRDSMRSTEPGDGE